MSSWCSAASCSSRKGCSSRLGSISSFFRFGTDEATVLYLMMSIVLPMTAPSTGTAMSACPTKEDIALTAASKERSSAFSMNSSSSIWLQTNRFKAIGQT